MANAGVDQSNIEHPDGGLPFVHGRGLAWDVPAYNMAALLRQQQCDIFR